jgi:hypothetical protein
MIVANIIYCDNSITASSGVWTVWGQNFSTAATTYTNQSVWTNWSTTGIVNYTWGAWNDTFKQNPIQYASSIPARAPTQAQLLAAKVAQDKSAAEWRERESRRVAEASAAKRRAETLLRSHLTEQQRKDLDAKNCFYLESIGSDGDRRRYRIDRGTHGNVKLLDKEGRIIGSYCVQPSGVPAEDAMLAQKLWLETDESTFKKVANFTRHG